jgi:hypothetical protein
MAADWETQRRWLIASYPEDYHWHLDFQTDWFAPGILAWLKNLLSNSGFQHFSITKHRQLIGVATFQSNPQQGKLLWMACDPQWEDEAFRAFLSHLDSFRVKEKISLDYPALRAVQPLQEFGFTPTQTLIWMNRPIAGHKPIALQNTLSRTH